MNEITITEAKARLPEIIRRVENGEEFLITKHDKVVAELNIPREQKRDEDALQNFVDLCKRKPIKATVEEIIQWKNEGRP